MRAILTIEAITTAHRSGLAASDAIMHTDRGSHHHARTYRTALGQLEIRQNTSHLLVPLPACSVKAGAGRIYRRYNGSSETRAPKSGWCCNRSVGGSKGTGKQRIHGMRIAGSAVKLAAGLGKSEPHADPQLPRRPRAASPGTAWRRVRVKLKLDATNLFGPWASVNPLARGLALGTFAFLALWVEFVIVALLLAIIWAVFGIQGFIPADLVGLTVLLVGPPSVGAVLLTKITEDERTEAHSAAIAAVVKERGTKIEMLTKAIETARILTRDLTGDLQREIDDRTKARDSIAMELNKFKRLVNAQPEVAKQIMRLAGEIFEKYIKHLDRVAWILAALGWALALAIVVFGKYITL